MTRFRTSTGFVMIASLLFLIVLTLLGISAMSTVGLQERMASNLKEKARATELAEVAMRADERFLSNATDIPTASASPVAGQVWTYTSTLDFLATSTWTSLPLISTHSEPPFDTAALIGTGLVAGASAKYFAAPQSVTEEAAFVPYSLDPDDIALGRGLFYYRVTGRGFGGNATALSILQSMYMQRYR